MNERVTLEVKTGYELDVLGLKGEETNKRLQKQIELGRLVRVSISKQKLLERMVRLASDRSGSYGGSQRGSGDYNRGGHR